MGELRRNINVKSKIRNYNVFLYSELCNADLDNASYDLIIADTNVKSHFEDSNLRIEYIDCFETTKSWDNLEKIIDLFILNNLSKKSKILIVGGGVLQDSISFCCSIFNRGISFDFMPTTLLSMVDSCIGGKTSINYKSYKNKLGNFYPPEEIIIVTSFIKTLPEKEIFSGLGEVFKFHVLQFKFENFANNYLDLNYEELIFQSLKYKASILEVDEFDLGERLTLNYGHSFGHSLESIAEFKIPHGIAVILGMMIANEVSFNLGIMSSALKNEIEKNASIYLDKVKWEKEWFDFEIIHQKLKKDKKNTDGIRLVLMNEKKKIFELIPLESEILAKSFLSTINRLFNRL